MLQFHHTNTGGFLLYPKESGNCDPSSLPKTLRASPISRGNWEERPIQLKEKVKNRSDWLKIFGERKVEISAA
jgi:hypothetical protein